MSDAATSSLASAPPSSPCPVPSTAYAPSATPIPASRWCSLRPTRRSPTAPRFRGRLRMVGRRGRRGAFVVLVDGAPLAYLERGARSLVTFAGAADDRRWAPALRALVTSGRLRKVEIAKVDGEPVRESPAVVEALTDAGFSDGYRGLVARAAR